MNATLPLRQLVGRLGALSVDGALDASVAGLAYDPRRVVPGAVFFAVPRSDDDASQAIPRAIERGAAAIVCEQIGFMPYRAARIRVANCRRAMATAAATFHGHPSRQMQVLVVTGCADRAPVAHALFEILESTGAKAGLIGSLGCRVAERILPALGPEPEALDIQEMLAGMQRSGCRVCVVELPRSAVRQGCLDSTELDMGIVTELAPFSDRAASEADLGTGKPGSGTTQFDLNGNGPMARTQCRLVASPHGGTGDPNDLCLRLEGPCPPRGWSRGRFVRLGLGSTRLEVRTPVGRLALRVPFPGRANARAALAAGLVALARGVPRLRIEAALARMQPVPGHLEPVPTRREFHVLVDGCRTALELEHSLRAVRELTSGRVLLLFGCGSVQEWSARPGLGEVAARGSDLAVLTADNPAWEPGEVIAAQVASGYMRIGGVPLRYIPDRIEAIRTLFGEAAAGDCVLLAGKGHRTVQQIRSCVLPFDDRSHARAVLREFDGRARGGEGDS